MPHFGELVDLTNQLDSNRHYHAHVHNSTDPEGVLNASAVTGVWTVSSGTWTLPALTLGGNVSSTGNPSLNIGTGALTAGSFAVTANSSLIKAGGWILTLQNSASTADSWIAMSNTSKSGRYGVDATGLYALVTGSNPFSVYVNGGKISDTTATGYSVTGTITASSTIQAGSNVILPKTSGVGLQVDTASPTFGWRDLLGRITPKATGAGSPARAAYAGANIGQYAFAAGDVVDMEFHIPHDYVPGTDLYAHIHWSHNGTTISGNAVFDLYSSYAKGHNQANFPAEKNVTITYATTDIATTPQYRHRIDEAVISSNGGSATLLDRAAFEPDGLVLMTLKMTTLPTLSAGAKLFIHFVDLHYQSTSMGTKQKAPNFYT